LNSNNEEKMSSELNLERNVMGSRKEFDMSTEQLLQNDYSLGFDLDDSHKHVNI